MKILVIAGKVLWLGNRFVFRANNQLHISLRKQQLRGRVVSAFVAVPNEVKRYCTMDQSIGLNSLTHAGK